MFSKNKNNKGFTLVELLVVIAIIGILAVVAVPALFKNIEKGKVADLEADISAIRSAALSVYADTSSYPSGEVTGSGGVQDIDKELEGLSKPFGATYSIILANENPNMCLLQITVGNAISQNGAKKLANDLGDKYVNDSGGTISSSSASKISAGENIYIKIMSK